MLSAEIGQAMRVPTLKQDYPDATALVAIGCAGDANPAPRTGLNFARQHGHAIAAEVNRLLGSDLVTLQGELRGQVKQIDLPFDKLPTRQEWEQRVRAGRGNRLPRSDPA